MNARDLDCYVKIPFHCDMIVSRIERFSITKETFVSDSAISDMLLMPLVQIGELSIRIGEEALSDTMSLNVWRHIRGFRNLIVHSYGSLDLSWAWATVEEDIPELQGTLLMNDAIR